MSSNVATELGPVCARNACKSVRATAEENEGTGRSSSEEERRRQNRTRIERISFILRTSQPEYANEEWPLCQLSRGKPLLPRSEIDQAGRVGVSHDIDGSRC